MTVVGHGAGVNVVDRYDGTPALDALRHRHADVLAFLRAHGARLPAESIKGAHERNAAGLIARLHALASRDACRDESEPCCSVALPVCAGPCTARRYSQDVVPGPCQKAGKQAFQVTAAATGLPCGAGDLFRAAAEGDSEFVELLVASGGLSPNVADFHGRTALHLATSNAHLGIVQFLVAQPVRPCSAEKLPKSLHAYCEEVSGLWHEPRRHSIFYRCD